MSFFESNLYRYAKKTVKKTVPVALALYFFPVITIIFFAIGFIDVSRNRPLNWSVLHRYFFGNGILTWVLAPFNLLLDLITLPFRNRGVYALQDLPLAYRREIEEVISTIKSKPELLKEIIDVSQTQERTMVFFRWYGKYIDAPYAMPEFEEPFEFVRTVGISVFKANASTGLHFGPLRATIRVLYNLTDLNSEDVYIEVGEKRNVWKKEPMFIFDDTLQHCSINHSDEFRACMFVDILRPSYIPAFLSAIIYFIRLVSYRGNFLFYKNWKLLK